jgi:hypothetical protein
MDCFVCLDKRFLRKIVSAFNIISCQLPKEMSQRGLMPSNQKLECAVIVICYDPRNKEASCSFTDYASFSCFGSESGFPENNITLTKLPALNIRNNSPQAADRNSPDEMYTPRPMPPNRETRCFAVYRTDG